MTVDATSAELGDMQRARFVGVQERVEEKMRRIAEMPLSNDFQRLLRRAEQQPRPLKKLRLLLEAASAWTEPAAKVAACRRGCSHCCHVPVMITSAEARLLSKASGKVSSVPLQSWPVHRLWEDEKALDAVRTSHQAIGGADSPCPFLRDSLCSVYASRPLACRTHFNMDDDDLLCRIVPGQPVNVPYLDARRVAALAFAMQPMEVVADVRAFFPRSSGYTAAASE